MDSGPGGRRPRRAGCARPHRHQPHPRPLPQLATDPGVAINALLGALTSVWHSTALLMLDERVRLTWRIRHIAANYLDATNWIRSAPRTPRTRTSGQACKAMAHTEVGVQNIFDTITEVVPQNPLDPDSDPVVQPITDFGAPASWPHMDVQPPLGPWRDHDKTTESFSPAACRRRIQTNPAAHRSTQVQGDSATPTTPGSAPRPYTQVLLSTIATDYSLGAVAQSTSRLARSPMPSRRHQGMLLCAARAAWPSC